MRIILVDISGGSIMENMNQVQILAGVGDRVICFDTRVQDMGIMASQDMINDLSPVCGGGTLLEPALRYLGEKNLQGEIIVITDGFLFDFRESKIAIDEFGLKISRFVFTHPPTSSMVKSLKELIA
jgi:predicted metal-dependent peptidase